MRDEENNSERQHYITGYPSLAAFISSDRDRTVSLYKRFDRLAARNLLHLQSELALLQAKQDAFDEEDRQSHDVEKKNTLRRWESFVERAQRDPRRMNLANEIREKLKEYREALLFESTLSNIPSPPTRTWRAFRTTFFNGTPGAEGSFATLGGASKTLYDDKHDLVSLRMPEHQDRLTNFVLDYIGFLFRDQSSTSRHDSVAYASGRAISTFVSCLSILLSAILLIGAIVVLYKVQSADWRLGLIALFTALFAGSIGLLTNARRAETFAATAAYAAVLVVFVSGNLGSAGG